MSLSRILAVGKEPQLHRLAQQVGQETFAADSLADALNFIGTINPDLILFDHRFGPKHIQELLDTADKNSNNIPIIVVGDDNGDSGTAAEFIQMGAYDYLRGKQDYSRLEQIVSRIKSKSPNKVGDTQESMSHFFAEEFAASIPMVGRSKAIVSALKMIKLVAESSCNPVLIVGETGTGKELAAKSVHILRHPHKQFIAVNCAALTASLLESELFGHMKGAFTGADHEKTGLLELAGSGVLFLDEISEMPLDLQAKLLRVLQERTFRKVGGIKDIECEATIIVSSNRNLQQETQAGRFRRDLYYRLNISPITIAPLRSPERREDIQLLAEYFLKTSTIFPEKRNKITSLTKFTIEALQKHDWPGNVRELRNVIDRAILLETTDKIGLNSIILDLSECAELLGSSTASRLDNFSLAKAERELISRALEETGWQKTKAAALLGITRATLYAKVKEYNIEKGSYIAREVRNEVPAPVQVCP
jgi:DNA-binding NtrC family response regulator